MLEGEKNHTGMFMFIDIYPKIPTKLSGSQNRQMEGRAH